MYHQNNVKQLSRGASVSIASRIKMKIMHKAACIMKIKKDDQLDIVYSNQPPLCVNLSFHPMYTHIYVHSHSNIKRNALVGALTRSDIHKRG